MWEYIPEESLPTCLQCSTGGGRGAVASRQGLWWVAVGRAVVGGGAGEGSSLQQEQLHVLTCQSQLTNQIKL